MRADRLAASVALAASLLACSDDGRGGLVLVPEPTGADGESEGEPEAECTLAGLSLSEAYSAEVISTVLERGGSSEFSGSCGGAGVDQGYRFTARKAAWYSLSVLTENDELLTVHVHEGDTCDGPELDCAVGPSFRHELWLEQDESVVIVVDTDSDLAIPAMGLRYSVGVAWADPPPEPCEDEALAACEAAPVASFEACMAGWACGDFEAAEQCQGALADETHACREMFCPSGPYYPHACEDACNQRFGGCERDGCDANTCMYERYLCADRCSAVVPTSFEFEYDGDCVLSLPGPLEARYEYYGVEIDGQFFGLSELGLTCGEPGAEDVVWVSESSFMLCEAACEAFALAGSARFVVGFPPD